VIFVGESAVQYQVTVFVDTAQELLHISYLYAGLSELEDEGLIELRFERLDTTNRSKSTLRNVFVQAEVYSLQRRQTKNVIFDLKDQNDVIEPTLFDRCDHYFKRNLSFDKLVELTGQSEGELKKKVAFFGMAFACRPPGAALPLAMDFVHKTFHGSLKTWPNSFKEGLRRYVEYLRHPKLQPASSVGTKRTSRVIFQTRLWQPHEVINENVAEINQQRVSLIRKLRQTLGDRFHGGLVPTAMALKDYPELACGQGYRHSEFMALMRNSTVGISTRGLFHSTPWKLAEYLSAGLAVVSDSIQNQLPGPLESLIIYRSEDECVEACVKILDTPDLARRMSESNLKYYDKFVHPRSAVKRCLDLCFATAQEQHS
jgi:hypothetical protein